MIKPIPVDPIRIDHTGIYLGDKAIPGVIRWTARHEPDRGVFELQLTLVTSACHVSLDAPAGQILGGPVGQQARAGVAASIEKIRTNTMIGSYNGDQSAASYNAPAPAAPTAAPAPHNAAEPAAERAS